MQDMIGNATWYVCKGEKESYLNHGASNCVEVDGIISVARNHLLHDSYSQKFDCLMLDDDLKKIEDIQVIDGKNKKIEITMKEVVDYCRSYLKESGLKLAGTSWITNALWYNSRIPVRFDREIAQLFYSKPCDVYFDENFVESEDQDYVLQHITKFGGVVNIEHTICTFDQQYMNEDNRHNNQKGGLTKTLTSRKKAYNQMKKKWGTLVKDRKFVKSGTTSTYGLTFNRRRGRK